MGNSDKARIAIVGVVKDGIAENWAIEGGDYPAIYRDTATGKEYLGGWSVEELKGVEAFTQQEQITGIRCARCAGS